MKIIQDYIKEIGIVISYISMLVACYIFDWKPFGIFISYLIEIVVLLFVYVMLRVKDEKRNPRKYRYRKVQPISNLFIGLVPLVLFQYFMIGWMSEFIDPDQNFTKQNLLLTKEVLYAVVSMIVLYSIKAAQITTHKERLIVFQDNFIIKVLALTGTNILGFTLVISLEIKSLLLVLTIMVIIRIIIEIYFGRKMKFI
ncbi:MAG: hypothetical protein COA32_06470 [Fluviicola sp.]|nr:MAG: hypothetical protein COA32_06470 [Fluviicola sp.]